MTHIICTAAHSLEGEQVLAALKKAVTDQSLRRIDYALAQLIYELQPDTKASVLLAVALTSQQLGQQHSCLDLQWAWSARSDVQNTSLWQLVPAEFSLDIWLEDLRSAACVTCDGSALETLARPLVLQGQYLYLRRYWQYEQQIVEGLAQRLAVHRAVTQPLLPMLTELFPESLMPDGVQSTDWQKIACALAVRGSFTLISGGPGTGKTTSVVRLLALLQQTVAADTPLRIALAAPTGKAAARLSAAISDELEKLPLSLAVRAAIPVEVSTLHRLLGSQSYTRQFKYHAKCLLPIDVLVVDEASMIDLEIMAHIFQTLPASARLIMLGDQDQLASVEAGAVLAELCADAQTAGYSPATTAWLGEQTGEQTLNADSTYTDAYSALTEQVVILRHSRRFSADSAIGKFARLVKQQQAVAAIQLLEQMPEGLALLSLPSQHAAFEECIQKGYAQYLKHLQQTPKASAGDFAWSQWAALVLHAFEQFRVLSPHQNEVHRLNHSVRALLHKRHYQEVWYAGRPVLVTRNDYSLGLMNGDVGMTLWVPNTQSAFSLQVAFLDDSGGVRFFAPERLMAVETAYAMTVHKAQGSECAHTLLVVPAKDSPVLTKELLYTAITRAKHQCTVAHSGQDILRTMIERSLARRSGLSVQLRRTFPMQASADGLLVAHSAIA